MATTMNCIACAIRCSTAPNAAPLPADRVPADGYWRGMVLTAVHSQWPDDSDIGGRVVVRETVEQSGNGAERLVRCGPVHLTTPDRLFVVVDIATEPAEQALYVHREPLVLRPLL